MSQQSIETYIHLRYQELIKDINSIPWKEAMNRHAQLRALQAECRHPNIRPSPEPLHYKAYCPDCGFVDADYL